MQQDMTIVEAVNRTLEPLNFMFDGVPGVVHPGYKRDASGKIVPAGRDGQPFTTPMTKVSAEYARRQNVKLGTEDRYSGEAEFLVGIGVRTAEGTLVANEHWLYNRIDPTDKGVARERLDRSTMPKRDQGVVEIEAAGYPRGRGGAEISQFQFNDGPTPTSR